MFEKIIEVTTIFLLLLLGITWDKKDWINVIIKFLLLGIGVIKLFFILKYFNLL